jgi:hypothetical protein
MNRFSILIFLLARGFAADTPTQTEPKAPESKPAAPQRVIRMYPLKYADADQFRKLFSSFSYPMSTNRDFNVLIVNAPPSFLEQVDVAVREFDVAPPPPKNFELTVYLITAADAPASTPLPKELQEMEKQLVASSPYKAFHLADSQVIRTRTGQSAESSSQLLLTQVRFRAGWINSDEKGRIISLDGLRVQLKNTAISTDIDLREGQLAVIGKANPDGLLLATAKVSE